MVSTGEIATDSDVKNLKRKMTITTAVTFVVGLFLPSPLALL